jgi:hypothetical protein
MGEETVPLPQLSSAHQSGVEIAGDGFKIETSDFCTSCETIVNLMLHLNFENSGERCLSILKLDSLRKTILAAALGIEINGDALVSDLHGGFP